MIEEEDSGEYYKRCIGERVFVISDGGYFGTIKKYDEKNCNFRVENDFGCTHDVSIYYIRFFNGFYSFSSS